MNIDDNWMQHNYSCTIQEFLTMNYDEWFKQHYNCTQDQFRERTMLCCKPDSDETVQQCAERTLRYIREKYMKALDMIYLQGMELTFEEWMEAYHMPIAAVEHTCEAIGCVNESKDILSRYQKRYQKECNNRKMIIKQEELKTWL